MKCSARVWNRWYVLLLNLLISYVYIFLSHIHYKVISYTSIHSTLLVYMNNDAANWEILPIAICAVFLKVESATLLSLGLCCSLRPYSYCWSFGRGRVSVNIDDYEIVYLWLYIYLYLSITIIIYIVYYMYRQTGQHLMLHSWEHKVTLYPYCRDSICLCWVEWRFHS